MIKKLSLFCLLFALAASPGCYENSAEFVREISVDALLSTGRTPQFVTVYYTTDKFDEAVDDESLFARDAQVLVKSSAQEIQFHYTVQRDTFFFDGSVSETQWFVDAPDSLRVLPGETYRLRVQTDAGVITGETTVPGEFEIEQPRAEAEVSAGEELSVSWTESPGAAWYVVTLIHPPREIVISPDTSVFRRRTASFETSETQLLIPGNRITRAGEYDLIIEACDENYRRFVVDGFDRGGIQGGYGFFGGKNAVRKVFEVL